MNEYSIPSLKSKEPDERYVELVNDLFVKYCESEKIDESLDSSYLEVPQYGGVGKLNKRLVRDERVLGLVEKEPIYEALYRVFLSSFRKYKKPYGLLNESIVDRFNSFVGVVSALTSTQSEGSVSREPQKLFESGSKNVTVRALKRRLPNDIDNMRIVSTVQKAFTVNSTPTARGSEKCAVYVTSFSPFTNSQMENVQRVSSQWNVPVLLASVKNVNRLPGEEFCPSDELVRAT